MSGWEVELEVRGHHIPEGLRERRPVIIDASQHPFLIYGKELKWEAAYPRLFRRDRWQIIGVRVLDHDGIVRFRPTLASPHEMTGWDSVVISEPIIATITPS